MEKTSFTTNPRSLDELLKEAANGKLQLPDFQRSWVWDEQRIIDLIASIGRDFPIGAIMSLKTGGEVNFHPRPIQGVVSPTQYTPEELLLDGQQRITSIYQVAKRGEVVETTTIKHKKIKRWFYADIRKVLNEDFELIDALFSIPEDKKFKISDDWPEGLDLSTREDEFANLIFPISEIFNWNAWHNEYIKYLSANGGDLQQLSEVITPFHEKFIRVFENYDIPVISLGQSTSKEAVCTVFEKVNTGGKALDAFELVTAMYAAEEYKLRDDWFGSKEKGLGYQRKISALNSIGGSQEGVLAKVDNTDFLQVISLFHTRDLRLTALENGKQGKDLPQVTGKRSALLNLPLDAYKKYKDTAMLGFERAAKFLHTLNIFWPKELPYQSQVISLAAILADIGHAWENGAVKTKLIQWYWCGVFGELYGSAVDTRIGNDFMQFKKWLNDEAEAPKTIHDANFRKERLFTMRMRLSAAYKGVNVLLMHKGAKDFISGQEFSHTAFFDEAVDIHHIFPKKWCETNGKDWRIYDSIANKTPLSARTNRVIGGVAPSQYIAKIENGDKDNPAINDVDLKRYLCTHAIEPDYLMQDNFDSFVEARSQALFDMILAAMGKKQALILSEDEDIDEWGEMD